MINNALPDAFDEDTHLAWHAPAPAPNRSSWASRLRLLAAQVAAWFRTRIVRRLRVPPVYVIRRMPVAQLPPDDPQPQLEPPKPSRLLEARRLSPSPPAALPAPPAAAPPARRSVILTLPPPDFEPDGDYEPLPPPQGFCKETVVLDEAAAARGTLRVLQRPAVPAIPATPPQAEDEPLLMLLAAPSASPAARDSAPPASAPLAPATPTPVFGSRLARGPAPAVVTLTRTEVPPRTVAVDTEPPPTSSIEECWIAPQAAASAEMPPVDETSTAGESGCSTSSTVDGPEAPVELDRSLDPTTDAEFAEALSTDTPRASAEGADAALLLAGGDPEPELRFCTDAECDSAAEPSADGDAPLAVAPTVEPPQLTASVVSIDPEAMGRLSVSDNVAPPDTSSVFTTEVESTTALPIVPVLDLGSDSSARTGTPGQIVEPLSASAPAPADPASAEEPSSLDATGDFVSGEEADRPLQLADAAFDAVDEVAEFADEEPGSDPCPAVLAAAPDIDALMFDLSADAADDGLDTACGYDSVAPALQLDRSESAADPLALSTVGDVDATDDCNAPILKAEVSRDFDNGLIGDALNPRESAVPLPGNEPIDVSADVLEADETPASAGMILDLSPASSGPVTPDIAVVDEAVQPWSAGDEVAAVDVEGEVVESINPDETGHAAVAPVLHASVGNLVSLAAAMEPAAIGGPLATVPMPAARSPELPVAALDDLTPAAEPVSALRPVVYVQDGGVLPHSARRVRRITTRVRRPVRRASDCIAVTEAPASFTVFSTEACHDDGI